MDNQKTIGQEITFSGKGLQSGRKVVMTCKPAQAGSGIIFERLDIPGVPALRLGDSDATGRHKRRSAISFGPVEIQTVEHFLAALWALGIDNLRVRLNGSELPAMGGSAVEFFASLKNSGITEQTLPRKYIKIQEPLTVEEQGRSISIFPGEGFDVSYTIDYKAACIGRQGFRIELDEASFEKEIAPARTFCMKSEALKLLITGCGRGATLNNTLVIGNKGPLGTAFRFKDEPVRHKILDMVGDLYMLGRRITGRIVAEKSGHSLNALLLQKINEKYGQANTEGSDGR